MSRSRSKGDRWEEFWARSARQQGATPRQSEAAVSKRKRKWESDNDRLKRHHQDHWALMKRGREELQGKHASPSPSRVCSSCKNARTRLVPPDPEWNGGYGYLGQCNVCLKRMVDEGWGDGVAFLPEDDELICKLLNANGGPMFEGYAPSRMHFYRSVLAFHDAFRHKRWEALVDHIRANFTTTMSMPNAATPGYRGWYRKDIEPVTTLEARQLSI